MFSTEQYLNVIFVAGRLSPDPNIVVLSHSLTCKKRTELKYFSKTNAVAYFVATIMAKKQFQKIINNCQFYIPLVQVV